MCDQEAESCGCVDEECTGGRVQEAEADTAGLVFTVAGNSREQ